MSEIKFTDVIRCSSEDPLHPSANLLKGSSNSDQWLCSPQNKESSAEVELQFSKEAVISYVDIGNYGSQSVDILVSHSSRSKDVFVSLVPTFIFMSVAESKQGINKTKVQMFNGNDMMQDIKCVTWDRMKLVCHQPYANGKQFGLSFVCAKMISQTSRCVDGKEKNGNDKNQSKLNDLFDSLSSERLPKSKVSIRSASPNTNGWMSLSTSAAKDRLDSSGRKAPKSVMSSEAISQFKEEVDCFLEDISFKEILQHRTVKVSDLRQKMERQRALALNKEQKLLFMEMIAENLKSYKSSKENLKEITQNPKCVKETKEKEEHCSKCHLRLPADILSIHSQICTNDTPKARQASVDRNRLCFDTGYNSEDDGTDSRRKRKRTSSEMPSIQGDSIKSSHSPFTSLKKPPVSSHHSSLGIDEDSSDDSLMDSPVSSKLLKPHARSWSSRGRLLDSFIPDRNKSPLKDVAKSGKITVIDENSSDDLTTVSNDLDIHQCPICFQHYPLNFIGVHASSCEGQTDEVKSGDKILVSVPTYADDSSSDQVSCPVCHKTMDKGRIEVHVNICLDFAASPS